MDELTLNGYQAMQLLALGPCIFMIAFLLLASRKPAQAVVPVLFFFALACGFCLPLLESFPRNMNLEAALLMGRSMTSSLIFLLVVQFVSGKVPPPLYWAILALPLVGGGTMLHATLENEVETCIFGNVCMQPIEFRQLYNIFSASFTLLLTIAIFSRIERTQSQTPELQKNTNALVFALIMLNAALLAIGLMKLSGEVPTDRADIALTVVRIGFIYLVLTSMFRVFDRSFEIAFDRVPTLRPAEPTDRERELADKVCTLMKQEKLYRTMDIGREKLAKTLAVTEHALSRAVNMCCAQSVSALINNYRVEEAQERLAKEETAITTIAFEVGFNSIPSFNRVFKQATGVAPSTYRAAKQAKPS